MIDKLEVGQVRVGKTSGLSELSKRDGVFGWLTENNWVFDVFYKKWFHEKPAYRDWETEIAIKKLENVLIRNKILIPTEAEETSETDQAT